MSGILLAFTGGSYGSPPVNTVAPAVTGTAQVRQTLSCSTGTWDGVPAPTFTYQWQSNSSNISGATSSTYQIIDAYVGTVMRCVVTATNPISVASANSNATSSVTANVPGAPTIGTATALSASTASITFSAPTGDLATGGSAITGYTMYSSGGQTATGSSSPITITGLNPESSYNFYVRANNAIGQSANSGTSNTITTPASYFISLSGFSYSQVAASGARVFGSTFATTINGAAAYGGVPSLGVNTSTGNSSYAVIGGTGATIYPWYTQSLGPNIPGPSTNGIPSNGLIDSSGDTYAFGTRYGSGTNYPLMNKTNSSGSKLWGLQVNRGSFGGFNSARFDQGGNIMTTGGTSASFYMRISTGGSVLSAYGSGSGFTLMDGDVDNSGNVALTGAQGSNSSNVQPIMGKFNSGTRLYFNRYFINGTQSGSNRGYFKCGMCVGADMYVGGFLTDDGSNVGVIAKLNGSDGSVAWQRNYTPYCMFFSVTYESDGYLYWGGQTSNQSIIVKTDLSGNEVWSRYVGGTNMFNGRAVVSGGNLFITGVYNLPNYAPYWIKVPNDGSKQGSYSVGGYTITYGSNAVTPYTSSSLSNGGDSGQFTEVLNVVSDTYSTSDVTSQTTTVLSI